MWFCLLHCRYGSIRVWYRNSWIHNLSSSSMWGDSIAPNFWNYWSKWCDEHFRKLGKTQTIRRFLIGYDMNVNLTCNHSSRISLALSVDLLLIVPLFSILFGEEILMIPRQKIAPLMIHSWLTFLNWPLDISKMPKWRLVIQVISGTSGSSFDVT